MSRTIRVPLGLALLLAAAGGAGASSLDRGIHHYRLDNGLDLVVAVRPELRLAAVNLTAAVGSIDDPPGRSGLAHVLEHVTLAGSVRVGSLDPKAEATALAAVDRAFENLRAARRRPDTGDAELARLEASFEAAHAAARRTAEPGEILGGRLEARGAVGLNATTSADATQYFTWIPAGEIETWLTLEADRLQHPIFRRFYSEREVVLQEVEALTGGRPTLQERLLAGIRTDAPAARPLAGKTDEIAELARGEVLAYFHRVYRPENLAIAVVGNVDPQRVLGLVERLFGAWRPTGEGAPLPAAGDDDAALPAGLHAARFNSSRAPIVLLAAPHPGEGDADGAGLDALAALINSPALSPLRRRLADRAWHVQADAWYPSRKLPSVFLLRLYGNPGVAHTALESEARAALAALAETPDEDLAGALLQAEMALATELDDPPTMASLLALHQAVHDDWRLPIERLERLRELTPADLRKAIEHLLAVEPEAGEPPREARR